MVNTLIKKNTENYLKDETLSRGRQRSVEINILSIRNEIRFQTVNDWIEVSNDKICNFGEIQIKKMM